MSVGVLLALAACAAQPAPAASAHADPKPVDSPATAASASPAPAPTLPSDSMSKPPAGSPPPAPSATPEPVAPLALPKGTLVLQIGDSFAAALGVELGKLLKAQGVRSALEYKTASYIPNWSYDGDVPKFVSTYHPDLVLITLGANEIEIPKPEMRAGPIKHLVGELGGRPCVWVAPPLWKPDTGLLKVIKDNIAPCRYLDSNALVHDLPRGHDKIHPSPEGREIWAKIVFDWLSNERIGSDKQAWALKPEPAAN
ncbi:MAG TPA: SGNH/GDSL hydrolase family protein [Polyangiaceae bacterium]|nr:SGNH/GDSL hydrolase family protein [Polyangiaceae bacterium]